MTRRVDMISMEVLRIFMKMVLLTMQTCFQATSCKDLLITNNDRDDDAGFCTLYLSIRQYLVKLHDHVTRWHRIKQFPDVIELAAAHCKISTTPEHGPKLQFTIATVNCFKWQLWKKARDHLKKNWRRCRDIAVSESNCIIQLLSNVQTNQLQTDDFD
jgi:hypothetical protein